MLGGGDKLFDFVAALFTGPQATKRTVIFESLFQLGRDTNMTLSLPVIKPHGTTVLHLKYRIVQHELCLGSAKVDLISILFNLLQNI